MTEPADLDDLTAERLLRGEVDPAEAPAGYEALAGLLRQARLPATREERMVGAALPYAAPVAPAANVTLRRRQPGRRALALAAASAVVLVGGSAAAATGSLPAPAQDAVSSVAARIGIDLPAGGEPDLAAPGPASTPPGAVPPVVSGGPPSAVPPTGEGAPPDATVVVPSGGVVPDAATPGTCVAFAAGQGQDLGLLRNLYRTALADPAAELPADPAPVVAVVVELCRVAGSPLPEGLAPPAAPGDGAPSSSAAPGQDAGAGPAVSPPAGAPAAPPSSGPPSSEPPASTPPTSAAPPSAAPPSVTPPEVTVPAPGRPPGSSRSGGPSTSAAAAADPGAAAAGARDAGRSGAASSVPGRSGGGTQG